MNNWLPVLCERLQREPALVRVVVATVRGSAPREAGACMLIGADRSDGSIGGGHLELKATEIARLMLEQPSLPARLDRFALGATLGQCCGGAVNLWFERYDADDRDGMLAAQDLSRCGSAAVMVTRPPVSGSLTRSLHVQSGHTEQTELLASEPRISAAVDALLTAGPGAPRAVLARNEDGEALIERIDPAGTPLWLFGAGHTGKALVNVLAGLPFRITWVDSRRHEFPSAPPDGVHCRYEADPAAAVASAPADAFFLVMTHSHDLDYEISRAILRRGEFRWAGLIGSETKAACFNLRFGREDIPPHTVARLVSPIGIEGIDSKLPGAIAVSVAAQLLQLTQAAASDHLFEPQSLSGTQPS